MKAVHHLSHNPNKPNTKAVIVALEDNKDNIIQNFDQVGGTRDATVERQLHRCNGAGSRPGV